MDGFNCCIFAYGQTGSGKTFTMEGPVTNRGVNVRALHAMFEEGHARRKSLGMTFTFSVTMCEIYREDVYDLLQEGKSENGRWIGIPSPQNWVGSEQRAATAE